jgi:carbon monoxide dehydrogenase subunit G
MKLTGSYTLPAPQERVYALLLDPAVLARCMPGCEALDKTGENEYAMRMKMLLGSMSGLFDGKVTIADVNPPTSYRLTVEGKGKIGFMKGEGVLTLAPAENQTAGNQTAGNQTVVRFEGDVQVGGTIAAVGQRLIDTTSKMLIKRFFEKICREAAASETSAAD